MMMYLAAVCVMLLTQCPGYMTDSYFWHVTDLHYDPTYYSTQQSCNEDISNPGKYGDYECDPPYELLRSSVHGMIQEGRLPEFIIYTGDNPHHPKDRPASGIDHDYVLEMLRNITELFNNSFPTTKFVVSLGNHDYYPKDQLPGQTNPLYSEIAQLWKPWIGVEGVATFERGAYYTTILDPELKLRAVVVNTNLYMTNNEATAADDDPAAQYAWLEQVLTSARTNQEKVHLVTHVPTGIMPVPGAPSWLRESDNTRLTQIIREFSDVILGHYSCHEHLDGFRLVYNDEGQPAVSMFVAPSVSPWRARYDGGHIGYPHNPGIRKIFYDSIKGHLTDIEQWYLNLPRANQDQDDVWLDLYGFRRLYGIDNVTAPALHNLVERFKEYTNADFHNYYDMSTVGAKGVNVSPCSCDCKFRHICAMQNMDYAAFNICYSKVPCGVCGLRSSIIVMILGIFLWNFLS